MKHTISPDNEKVMHETRMVELSQKLLAVAKLYANSSMTLEERTDAMQEARGQNLNWTLAVGQAPDGLCGLRLGLTDPMTGNWKIVLFQLDAVKTDVTLQ